MNEQTKLLRVTDAVSKVAPLLRVTIAVSQPTKNAKKSGRRSR